MLSLVRSGLSLSKGDRLIRVRESISDWRADDVLSIVLELLFGGGSISGRLSDGRDRSRGANVVCENTAYTGPLPWLAPE